MGTVQEWNGVHSPLTRTMTCTVRTQIRKRDRTKMASSRDTFRLVNIPSVYTNHCDDYVSRATYFGHLKRGTQHEDENDSSSGC